jgi:hypothetical protein
LFFIRAENACKKLYRAAIIIFGIGCICAIACCVINCLCSFCQRQKKTAENNSQRSEATSKATSEATSETIWESTREATREATRQATIETASEIEMPQLDRSLSIVVLSSAYGSSVTANGHYLD